MSNPSFGLWTIVQVWFPLALTWAMMAAEGLILQSVLTRLPEAASNVAAFGVAIGIAFIVESPIIMLLSASTAFVKGAVSYRTVRAVALFLSLATMGIMLLIVLPIVYRWLSERVLALPAAVSDRVYWCLVALIPWPGTIGIRRFYQGIMIRTQKTRYVAYGTIFRLGTIIIGSTAAMAFYHTQHGAVIMALILSTAVTIEMIVTRFMAKAAIQQTLASSDPLDDKLTVPMVIRLYTPLALTSVITMGLSPILMAFMTRFPEAIASLAVFSVVDGMVFQFRSPLFAYQEVAISFFSSYGIAQPRIGTVGYAIATIATILLAAIAFSPLATIVYGIFPYQLSGSLVQLAANTTALLMPLPLASAIYSIERARLIVLHRSEQVTYSTLIEAGVTLATIMLLAAGRSELVGVYAAAVAVASGKIAASLYLLCVVRLPRSPGLVESRIDVA